MRKLMLVMMGIVVLSVAMAQYEWVHIYHHQERYDAVNDSTVDTVRFTRVKSFPADSVRRIAFIADTVEDNRYPTMTITGYGDETDTLSMCLVDSCRIGVNVPSIYIDIEDGQEVIEKEVYLNATLRINGNEEYESVDSLQLKIRGRGNTSWSYKKKPYRLKFDKKQSLCGLRKAKNFVLLANYRNHVLMQDAVAFFIARELGMPYTNEFVPVNVWINGTYRGAYTLTNKIGINSASVDISDETGILYELDAYYDEPFKFRSMRYNLPVMIKDPELDEVYATTEEQDSVLNLIKQNWNEMEEAVYNKTNVEQYIDYESLANYLLVYNVTGNSELWHPKSGYCYKDSLEDKLHFGPVWDFDWAYVPSQVKSTMGRHAFYNRIQQNSAFRTIYFARWKYFYEEVYPRLLEFMDAYAATVRVQALQNGELWPQEIIPQDDVTSSESFDANYQSFRQYMVDRVSFLNCLSTHGL